MSSEGTEYRIDYTEAELLETHDVAEPLIAGGVRCHGGFLDDGTYVSPRTRHRVPAIEAWQATHEKQFDQKILEVPLETWPENYPNVAQSKHLIRQGVREPIIAALTRIGTVEGFGAMIRRAPVPDFGRWFDEDARGTTLDHLGRGLFEAHGRDEAGFEAEAGHNRMWFAARDIAFENPVSEDQTALMLERMGLRGPGGGDIDPRAMREAALARRITPDDIDYDLEAVLERMVRILLIEVQAFHTFAWAEAVLSDNDLTAGDGEAARLVTYIRADETPHVEYLKTAVTDMRDRTWVGESGKKYAGTAIVGQVWDRALDESLGVRRDQNLQVTLREVEHALDGHRRRDTILEEFHALGTIRPTADGTFEPATLPTY